MPPKYSVVVPVYNAQSTLDVLSKRLELVFKKIKGSMEVVFVDDSSQDSSWLKIIEIHSRDARFKGIRLMKNFGQQGAVFCGLKYAQGDFIITMDDDLQHYPEDIPKLIKAISESKADIVFADFNQKKHSMVQNVGRRILNYTNSIVFSGANNIRTSSFRIIKRSVVNQAVKRKTCNPTIGPLLLTVTSNVANVKIDHHDRRGGRSGYGFFRLTKLALDVIVNNSALPLRIASIMGFIASVLAFCLGVYFIIRHFTGSVSLPGWTSIVVINLFFSGLTLFFMGIIGEYLVRITHQVKDYPAYIIREKRGISASQND